jgi:hypothetical protein
MVYIAEAHAVDEWPINSSRYVPSGEAVALRQPTNKEERLEACETFLRTYGLSDVGAMHVVVDDPIDEAFQKVFAPWPIRMYIVEDGSMQLISEPTECSHDVGALREWLDNRFKE